jgi:hypothetical protein
MTAPSLYTCDAESQIKIAARRHLSHDGDRRRDSWFGNPTRESIFPRGKRVAVILAGGHPIYYAEEMRGTSRILFQNNLAACYFGTRSYSGRLGRWQSADGSDSAPKFVLVR